ncbi:MAG: hypothetical protein NC180_04660 [Muribaculaceae bacterium]|nr:hypothetical protein [Roseburia sp.]MCM1430303.1 hypothetical protein [Muribaculaceae bacterium]MCM1492501.1 hypothetical protein [Muribaculaceae bacterium]
MGELLLCNEPIAALPFYVEGAGVNLYSMEELCYYIAGNTYLLDSSFKSEELCAWVEQEMGLYKLAEKLRSAESLSQFVETLLVDTCYYSPKEIKEILLVVHQMEEKTDFECSKLRADRLMENEKYISSIYEYKRLLESEEVKNENALIVGTVWHNLGTAYARLFLFGEALHCYGQAYERNQSMESLREMLLCCLCMHNGEEFAERAGEHHLDESEMQQLKEEFALASRTETALAFEERLKSIMEKEAGQAKQEIAALIFTWKEDYRKNCRM